MIESQPGTFFADVCNSREDASLDDLLKEACSRQVNLCDYSIGTYLKKWRGIKIGDKVIYSINNTVICAGEVNYVKSKAFRPLWMPDHNSFKIHAAFIRAMCHSTFDNDWINKMINVHEDAIEHKRWLFVVTVIISPILVYRSNKEILEDTIKQIKESEAEFENMLSTAYGEDKS